MKNPGIYILTNTINGKQYVGKDTNLPKRANQHLNGNNKGSQAIHRAIKKYSADNFEVEIIPYPNVPHQILCWFERSHIAQLDSFRNGYNQTLGGEGSPGFKQSEETKRKRSARISGKRHPLFGKNHTPESREKMSKSQRGRKHSPETRKKMSKAHKGHTVSKETRKKISESRKGNKVSRQTRQKLSDANKQFRNRKRSHFDKERGQRKLF